MRKSYATAAALLLAPLLGAPGAAEPIGKPFQFSLKLRPDEVHMKVRLRGALVLSPTADGRNPSGLSGLAWDADEELLYAVSDRGRLLSLRPLIEQDRLVGVDLIDMQPLRDEQGRPLDRTSSDAEALAILNGDNGIRGDTELLVAFESLGRLGRHRPDGSRIGTLELPAPLRDPSKYAGGNLGLEALAAVPDRGLVFGTERPLRDAPRDRITLYGEDGAAWYYMPLDRDHSAVVDLAASGPSTLIALERIYSNLLAPIVFSLREVALPPPGSATAQAVVHELARFSSAEHWAIDNFEGLCRHHDDFYFMVSDDNESSLQRTVLVYFERLP